MYGQRPEGDAAEPRRHWTTAPDGTVAFTSHAEVAAVNAALRRLDGGLASAGDMDLTLKLGLGYPEGPIELLERTGLAAHHDVTQALHQALGDVAYAPARRAQVAKARQLAGL